MLSEVKALRRVRLEQGLSLERLAQLLDIDRTQIYRWFRDQAKPSDLALHRIRVFLRQHDDRGAA